MGEREKIRKYDWMDPCECGVGHVPNGIHYGRCITPSAHDVREKGSTAFVYLWFFVVYSEMVLFISISEPDDGGKLEKQ